MLDFTTQAIAQILETPLAGDPAPVTGVSIDSRTIQPGDCFFAIAGENFDGHQYVARAFELGAACAVVRADAPGLDAIDGALLRVPDTILALGALARAYRNQRDFKVVAITGSVGKTTTRQIVHHVLSQHFTAHQARKNFNNTIGLPLTLLEADPDTEVIVAELGANQPGEIAYLTRIAQPDVAVVTNVHPAHLAGFGSLETIIKEKTSIADGLREDGVFFVNGDIDALRDACKARGGAFKTFGHSAGCDVRAEGIAPHGLSSTFTLAGQRVTLPLPGPGNVDNATAAWAVCAAFGLESTDFAQALASLPPVAMRAEPIQIGTYTVLNDCYNANPASMNNALAMLRELRGCDSCPVARVPDHGARATDHGPRRLVFVCGAMAELGAQSDALHAELGKAVAQAGVDLLLTVGDATKATAATARAAANGLEAEHFDDTAGLCENLSAFLRDHDIILVKGSRTAQLENVVESMMKNQK